MPRQNRVTPFGEIVANSARGTLMGNRGCLHDDHGNLTSKRWTHQAWVSCRLEFNGWKRELMTPSFYTELFFTDDAVAIAAGHRPCGTCRHDDYKRFKTAFQSAYPELGATFKSDVMNKLLHKDRVHSRSKKQITYVELLSELPDGVFFILDDPGAPLVKRHGATLSWSFEGYSDQDPIVDQQVTVLTPKAMVNTIRAEYVVDF
ncbi:MAG: hypothetical protein P8P99_07245 [Maricaulis sp.]|nr:hypothetical protein [Maricaulis sp.]